MNKVIVNWHDYSGQKHQNTYENFVKVNHKREFNPYMQTYEQTTIFVMYDYPKAKTTATFYDSEIDDYIVVYDKDGKPSYDKY